MSSASRKTFRRYWPVAVGALALVGLLLFVRLRVVVDSPVAQAATVFQRAAEAEAEGDRAAATEIYKDGIDRYHRVLDVSDQVDRYLLLHASYLGSPCDASHTQAASWLVNAYELLPAGERKARAKERVAGELARCAESMDVSRDAEAFAAISLLEQAAAISGRHEARRAYAERADALRMALAGRIRDERPVAAFRLYVGAPGDEALERARAILVDLVGAPWLWEESAEPIAAWLERAERAGKVEAARDVRRDQTAAQRRMDEIRERLAGASEQQLEAIMASSPSEPVALALATQKVRRGAHHDALAVLARVVPVGRMTGETQLLLGRCLLDVGEAERADRVLSVMLHERLPRYHRDCALLDVQRQRLAAGHPEVAALEKRVPRDGLVPRATVQLGFVRLYAGRMSSGDERESWLEGAQSAFLAGRPGCLDNLEYIVGLGVTFDLLGQTSEADAVFRELRRLRDPSDMAKARGLLVALDAQDRAAQVEVAHR